MVMLRFLCMYMTSELRAPALCCRERPGRPAIQAGAIACYLRWQHVSR